jgi:hypothetical protein
MTQQHTRRDLRRPHRPTPVSVPAAFLLSLVVLAAALAWPGTVRPAAAQTGGAIALEAPGPGAAVTSPVSVRGRVSATPPSQTLVAAVYDAQGRQIGHEYVSLDAPPGQHSLLSGTVVALQGTPYLWVAGEDQALHFAGDTRALGEVDIDWAARREVDLDELRRYRIGDPLRSAGLVKLGERIYLAKWETDQPAPSLYHIPSIKDLELFGINGHNYGILVLDGTAWSRAYGISAETLQRVDLRPVVG